MKKRVLLLFFLLLFPLPVLGEELIPNAKSGILIEAYSGKIVYEKNIDERLSVASMTKMVAQIIILEKVREGKIKWDDVVSVSKNASDMGGSQIYLSEGEEMSVEDLMKGISVASGNDATVAMAEYISGSEEKFVKLMNKKVKELGLKNTHFMNCTGLDEKNHYSSAYDMGIIARELVVNYPEILKFSSIYEDYLRENTNNKFWLVNTNKLIRQYEGVDGLKTGHTDDAGYCIATTIKKNDLRLIGIILGESDSKIRNTEAISLLEYGYKTIKVKKIKEQGTLIKKIKISKANKNYIYAILKDPLNVVEDIGESSKYKYNIKLNNIVLPIKQGDYLGKIEVLTNDNIVSYGNLISMEDVNRLSLIDLYKDNIKNLVLGNL